MQWKQMADGLDGRDVFALAQSPDGTVLAGTNSGIFAAGSGTAAWQPRNTDCNAPSMKTAPVGKTRVSDKKRQRRENRGRQENRIRPTSRM